MNNDPLSLIASNRRKLRKMGATSQTIQCVEMYFKIKRRKARTSLGDVARVLGIARQQVQRHMKRAQAMGLVARVGSTLILNVRGLLGWCEASAREKVEHLKRLYQKKKSESDNRRLSHNRSAINKKGEMVESDHSERYSDRQEALSALKAMYVPVHLRQKRGLENG